MSGEFDMNWRKLGFPVLVCGLLPLAACHNNIRHHTAQRLAAYQAAAQSEVSSFNYRGTLYSWQPLGEQALVVYTMPKKAYLLDVSLCPDLPYATGITVSNTVGQVMSHFDKVWVNGGRIPCQIEHIRPVDLSKLHAQETVTPRNIETVPDKSGSQGNNG